MYIFQYLDIFQVCIVDSFSFIQLYLEIVLCLILLRALRLVTWYTLWLFCWVLSTRMKRVCTLELGSYPSRQLAGLVATLTRLPALAFAEKEV